MQHWRSVLVAALGAMLAFTGCLEVDASIRIDDDGSGTVEVAARAETEAMIARLTDSFGRSLSKGMASDLVCERLEREGAGAFTTLPARLPAPVSFDRGDGVCGFRSEFVLASAQDHSDVVGDVLAGGRPARLVQDGDLWVFETTLDLNDLLFSDRIGASDAVPDLRTASIRVEVELPGQAVDGRHNATSVDGGTFVWDIDIENPPTRLFAQTEPATGLAKYGLSLVSVGVLILILAATVALGWFLFSGKPRGPSRRSATGTGGAIAAATPAALSPARSGAAESPDNPPVPVYDEVFGVWTIDDPVRGRLWHQENTDTWVPF